jgi:hypothetical protein
MVRRSVSDGLTALAVATGEIMMDARVFQRTKILVVESLSFESFDP